MFAASTKSASKSLVNRLLQTTKSSPLQVVARQSYMSRAHPSPIPEYPINQAVQMVLEGIEERKDKRAAKWERNAEKRQAKGIKVSST